MENLLVGSAAAGLDLESAGCAPVSFKIVNGKLAHSARSNFHQRGVDGDSRYPRRELRLPAETVEVQESSQEALVNHILGVVQIASDPEGEPEGNSTVLLIDLAE